MYNIRTFYLLLLILSTVGCVQKTQKKVMIIQLTVNHQKNINKVGIRGEGNPFSWENDFIMQPVIKDSIYQAIVTTQTAYTFTEIKFTVNGQWELENQPNRKIVFPDKKDTVFVNAVFNNQ